MAADIGKRAAAAGRVQAPAPRNLRIGHEVFRMNAAHRTDFADLAAFDDVLGKEDQWVLQIVEADLGDDAGLFRCFDHLAAFGNGRRQWLFAIDVLAMGDRRKRHLLVQEVRRGDVDDVDIRIGQEFPPVGRRLAEAQLAASALCALDGHVGDRNQIELEGQVEDPCGNGEAERMGLAHEARADQADAEFALAAHDEFLPGGAAVLARNEMNCARFVNMEYLFEIGRGARPVPLETAKSVCSG